MEAGSNRFYLSVNQFVEKTNAIGMFSKAGRYGGTYAHRDIAYNFGMWLSPEFFLLVIKEIERLKAKESDPLLIEWDIKRICLIWPYLDVLPKIGKMPIQLWPLKKDGRESAGVVEKFAYRARVS